jgi:hypothetical protein
VDRTDRFVVAAEPSGDFSVAGVGGQFAFGGDEFPDLFAGEVAAFQVQRQGDVVAFLVAGELLYLLRGVESEFVCDLGAVVAVMITPCWSTRIGTRAPFVVMWSRSAAYSSSVSDGITWDGAKLTLTPAAMVVSEPPPPSLMGRLRLS